MDSKNTIWENTLSTGERIVRIIPLEVPGDWHYNVEFIENGKSRVVLFDKNGKNAKCGYELVKKFTRYQYFVDLLEREDSLGFCSECTNGDIKVKLPVCNSDAFVDIAQAIVGYRKKYTTHWMKGRGNNEYDIGPNLYN